MKRYGRYFLATEADDVDIEITPNNRSTDFTKIEEVPSEQDNNTDNNNDDEEISGNANDDVELIDDTDFNNVDDSEDNDIDSDMDVNNTKNGPGLDYNSTRQYRLFNEYQDLRETIQSMLSLMEKYSTNDINKGNIANKVSDKLRITKTMIEEYMLTRFQSSTYIQNMIFYNTIVAACKSVIEMLRTMEKIDECK